MPISQGGGRYWIVTTYHSVKVPVSPVSHRFDDQEFIHLIFRSSAPGAISKAMGNVRKAAERRSLKNASVRRATVADLDRFDFTDKPERKAHIEANIREHAHEVT